MAIREGANQFNKLTSVDMKAFIMTLSILLGTTQAFGVAPVSIHVAHRSTPSQKLVKAASSAAVDADGLMDMDVVIYSAADSDERCIGAVQEDGTIAQLSAWSFDPAFGDAVELLVDEEDRPGYPGDQVVVHSIIPEESLSYGSRQVGGGKGTRLPFSWSTIASFGCVKFSTKKNVGLSLVMVQLLKETKTREFMSNQ